MPSSPKPLATPALAGARLIALAARPLQAFLRLEAASGLVLLACAVAALAWANLAPATYRAAFAAELSVGAGGFGVRFTVLQLVNDGLMTLFFFVVGMEIKRELVHGELRSRAQALLPAVSAVGGMFVPAAIFLAFNAGTPGAPGWGIPMATDIAFCVGVLTLLKRRVPHGLLVFVTALAVFDDIGGILVIALFYGAGVHGGWLAGAAAVALLAVRLGARGMRAALPWAVIGAALWFTLHHGGVHPTIAGVALGLAIPAGAARDTGAPLDRFVRVLHPWVAFGVMPVFALANSGVYIGGLAREQLYGGVALGTFAALVIGKQAGIFLFTLAAVRGGLARVPGGASWPKVLGVSVVAGIGFTVALFIAGLAYPGAPALLDEARLGILAGSLASGLLGAAVLRATAPVGAR